MYRLQKLQKWNPTLKPMIKLMHRFKWPMLDSETIESVDQCCNAIQARLNTESSSMQLLRDSDGAAVGAQEQLLRPTLPVQSDVNPVELVRATDHVE